MIKAVALLLLGLVATVSAADKEFAAHDVSCKIQGQSGKMTLTDDRTDTSIRIAMDFIKELSADGEEVGTAGKPNSDKHSHNSFASTEFTFSEITEAAPLSDDSTVEAISITFTANLVGSAELIFEVFLVTEDGEVHPNAEADEDKMPLERGQFKFNVEVRNWPFCTENPDESHADYEHMICSDGVGASLSLGIQFTGDGEELSCDDDNVCRLGGEIVCDPADSTDPADCTHENYNEFSFISTIMASVENCGDDAEEPCEIDMEDGFPSIEGASGGKANLELRFPRFENELKYDPIVTVGVSEEDSSAHLSSVLALGFAALFALLF